MTLITVRAETVMDGGSCAVCASRDKDGVHDPRAIVFRLVLQRSIIRLCHRCANRTAVALIEAMERYREDELK